MNEERKEVMSVYEKVSTNLNFVDREKQIETFWKTEGIFEKSMDNPGN